MIRIFPFFFFIEVALTYIVSFESCCCRRPPSSRPARRCSATSRRFRSSSLRTFACSGSTESLDWRRYSSPPADYGGNCSYTLNAAGRLSRAVWCAAAASTDSAGSPVRFRRWSCDCASAGCRSDREQSLGLWVLPFRDE